MNWKWSSVLSISISLPPSYKAIKLDTWTCRIFIHWWRHIHLNGSSNIWACSKRVLCLPDDVPSVFPLAKAHWGTLYERWLAMCKQQLQEVKLPRRTQRTIDAKIGILYLFLFDWDATSIWSFGCVYLNYPIKISSMSSHKCPNIWRINQPKYEIKQNCSPNSNMTEPSPVWCFNSEPDCNYQNNSSVTSNSKIKWAALFWCFI